MSLPLNLFRCRDIVCLATDKQAVNEHVNRDRKRRSPIAEMPKGSVILHNNKPYDIQDLTKLAHKNAKAMGIGLNKPYSIIVDDRFIK